MSGLGRLQQELLDWIEHHPGVSTFDLVIRMRWRFYTPSSTRRALKSLAARGLIEQNEGWVLTTPQ